MLKKTLFFLPTLLRTHLTPLFTLVSELIVGYCMICLRHHPSRRLLSCEIYFPPDCAMTPRGKARETMESRHNEQPDEWRGWRSKPNTLMRRKHTDSEGETTTRATAQSLLPPYHDHHCGIITGREEDGQ